MNESLLLKSSVIFEGADLIDCIRQTCIGLKNSSSNGEIKLFLKESIKYLKNDLPFNTANELFSAILSCFMHNPNDLSLFSSHFLKRATINSNFLIVTSMILSELIHVDPQPPLPDYQSFVNDALSQILPQIQQNEENDLILFDHKISPLFKNSLIVNLLLSCTLTEEIFLLFFPYLFTHSLLSNNQKYDMILQDISKEGTIHITSQTKTSDQEIYEFIKNQGNQSISSLSRPAISLIESVVIFIKCQEKKKIKGLKKETVLQFLAVLIIIIKNYKIQEKVTFSTNGLLNLFNEGVRYLNCNNNPLLIESIDLIVSNYFYINGTLSIPTNTLFDVFGTILSEISYDHYFGSKAVLFQAIFDLTEKVKYYNFRVGITEFFKEKGNLIIQMFLKNLNIINSDYNFKIKKLDLKLFDQSSIFNEFAHYQNPSLIIYFLYYSCTNVSIDELKKIMPEIEEYLILKIREREWEAVLTISLFLKKYDFDSIITPLTNVNAIPDYIKDQLVCYYVDESYDLNSFLRSILGDPQPETKENVFQHLFDKLVCDKKILKSYLTLLFTKYDENNMYPLGSFFHLFRKEYKKYKDVLIEVVNKMFDYHYEEALLIFKIDFVMDNFLSTPVTDILVSKLYEEISNKKKSFQAFYFLMNLANSFPLIFASNPLKVFTTVYPAISHLSLIFEKKEDEEHLPFIKVGYSALLFLVASLQAPLTIETYYEWLFKNIYDFNDIQVLCSFMILNILNDDNRLKNISQAYVIKYNFLSNISKLLDRNVQEGYFASCYKDNIYKYLTDTYECYLNFTFYIKGQTDEFMKKEHPICFAYNNVFNNYVCVNFDKIVIDANTSQLDQFMKNAKTQKEFWLTYDFVTNRGTTIFANSEDYSQIIDKLDIKHSCPNYIERPTVKTPITLHMARYLTVQKFWVYKNILLHGNVPLTNEMFKYFSDVVKHLNKLRKYADEHPDEEDEIDSSSFSLTDYFLPQYCQDSLIKSLINDIFLPSLNSKCVSSLCGLFHAYASNNVALLSILSIISQCFSDIYYKCIGYAPPSLLKVMYDLIVILTKMSDIKGFKENFFETCGNNLINIVLSPELRCDPILLWNVSKFFKNFSSLPIRVTQIIGFMIISSNEKNLTAAISLCSKFSYEELQDLNQLILSIFDKELKNEKRQSIIMVFINYSPSILEKRKSQMYSILKGLLKKFQVQKNEKIIDLMALIMNKLAPERKDFDDMVFSDGKLTEIPPHIKQKNPSFWNLFEKYMDSILSLMNDDPFYLNKFTFLLGYPELISFKMRSLLFRKTMKEMIDAEDFLQIHVDTEDILNSSYRCLIDEIKPNLLKKLYVIFNDSKSTIDFGGPTREWMSKLAKEIFNAKYGLFDCSKNMTYQPSSASYVQPESLEHFRFAGIFVARALIEGQCIDAHLTPSFIKQVLHQKLVLKDLEDVDEQLFNSLTWLLENDVENLDMYFEIDSEEFGVHNTIPLKENGSEIKVTNENKNEFVELNFQYVLRTKIKDQIDAFREGFEYLINNEKIRCFTPKEFDLLVCGVTDFDVNDFIENTVFEYPYSAESPVIKMFFKVLKSWDNEKLSKLLNFMTGSSRIPANGFKEFVEITGFPLKIAAGGDENCLPQTHTCFNTMDLPSYTNEEDLRNKLLLAIQECNTFGLI